MNNRVVIFLLILLFLGIGILWMLLDLKHGAVYNDRKTHKHSSQPHSSLSNNEPASNPMLRYLAAFRTPITLYGKVVDQHGNPVPNANVELTPFQNPFGEDNEKFWKSADSSGKFVVTGLKGSALVVRVTKEGYIPIYPDNRSDPGSDHMIEYDNGIGTKYTNPLNPFMFTLYKPNDDAPIIHLNSENYKLSWDGKPRKISITASKVDALHVMECSYVNDYFSSPEEERIKYGYKYNWSFKMSIPGGGFIPRTNSNELEAPEHGYQESISIEMPKNSENWQGSTSGKYFVKFSDGMYGRIEYSVSRDEAPLLLEAWISTKSGSREVVAEKYIESKQR